MSTVHGKGYRLENDDKDVSTSTTQIDFDNRKKEARATLTAAVVDKSLKSCTKVYRIHVTTVV